MLLAAGIGITPILSILKTALEVMPEREIIFIHGCKNEKVQAFRSTVDVLAKQHPKLKVHHCYSRPEDGITRKGDSTGHVGMKLIESLIPNHNADYYFCGSKSFMKGIHKGLLTWHIPDSQVYFEFFGPREELEGAVVESFMPSAKKNLIYGLLLE